ncbi:MAG TPA: hypothetical protein VGK36_03490 [Candidatus Angelobacter sp.]|jgi:hypothetical protein
MSQTIHIFKKDLKRFSWEIVLSILLLVLYAWCQPVLWGPIDRLSYDGGTVTALRYAGASMLGILLVLGWMAILVRVIYEESLTGDRQFWVTRPYRWQSLLAAKILFVFIVINLPLFAAQLCLVAAAGFAPFRHFSRVLALNLTLAILLLPLATLAMVTGGKRQMTRAIIMVLIFLVASVWLAQSFSGFFFAFDVRGAGSGRTGTWQWLVWAVMVGVAIVVIVRQYALRKTAQARWILVGSGLALILMAAAEPKPRFPEAEYQLLGAGADGYFEIKMPPESSHAGRIFASPMPGEGKKTIWMTPRFIGGEMAEGLVAQAEAIKLTFLAPDGTQWNSDWQGMNAVLNHNDSGTVDASALQSRSLGTFIQLDRTFWDKFKDVPINLQVEVASTLYRDHGGAAFILNQEEFKIQNVGTCIVSQLSEIFISCRSPLAGIPMVGVSVRLFKNCGGEHDPSAPIYQSYAWWPGSEQWSGEFGLNPVRQFGLSVSHEAAGQALTTCPESTFMVHLPDKIRRFRIQKSFNGVKLADMVPQQ